MPMPVKTDSRWAGQVCAVCEYVATIVENYALTNASVSSIEKALDSVCNSMPSPFNGECVLIVNAYLPELIDYVRNNEDPTTLCSQLALCLAPKPEKRDVE
jgi:saposin